MLSINPKILYVRDQKTKKFIPLVAIRGPKGPPGSIDNITDYLTNETGDSKELAISQKGFTAELKKITNSLEFLYGNGTLGLEYSIDGDTCSITGIGYAKNNTEIVIPSSIYNIPVTKIGDHAFESCKNLSNITMPNSITSIGMGAFKYCSGLTSIIIPVSVTVIREDAFAHCTKLTNIIIPDNVTTIGRYTFSECVSLTNVTIGNSVTSIGDDAFRYCKSLTSITIPNSVTSIGSSAFYACTSLTSIIIPKSVTSIGVEAFYGSKIKDIYYQGTEAEWEAIDIHEGNELTISGATIHFESSLPEA